ncbi:PREDICTED: transcription factor bHLH104-like [Nicotiana attenuata]|uniref:Transcription factor bhlh104 n=1 Tax=Nicotiana attenuata TaxID=49451 RepID=A0A314L1H5_NICAT|nr:PREDICTED: transcription factor bHLH104-like [Nicotiana attenuata]OIT35488.1 transcription factor bhlh104 [Nicotiana attenuata]
MDQLDSFRDNSWDLIDINSFIDEAPSDFFWNHQIQNQNQKAVAALEAPLSSATFQEECIETECPRKRGRNESCSKQGSKACRERIRREKLNERFSELCSVLEPGRPVKTDKMAILGDAIRVLNELKTESEEYKEMNQKLMEEIKTLKAEKNELREEKLALKAEKERMEQELKATATPASFIPPHPAAYQPAVNKMAVFPSYGYVPMWQYLPPSSRDTSQDHALRPPAA